MKEETKILYTLIFFIESSDERRTMPYDKKITLMKSILRLAKCKIKNYAFIDKYNATKNTICNN